MSASKGCMLPVPVFMVPVAVYGGLKAAAVSMELFGGLRLRHQRQEGHNSVDRSPAARPFKGTQNTPRGDAV